MKVNGKTVLAMLFAVAVASGVDPVAGLLAFLALLAAINPHRVVQMIYALDDGVQRAQRLLEVRRLIEDGADAGVGEGVTTAHITNNNTAVVTPEPDAPLRQLRQLHRRRLLSQQRVYIITILLL